MIAPQQQILETERLLLRHFTLADLDEIYRLVYADPVVKNAWSGRTGTPDEIKAGFAKEHIEPAGDFGLKAVIRKSDHQLLGLMGFQRHEPGEGEEIGYLLSESEPNRRVGFDPSRPDVELTYALGRAYWQQGYASEMGKVLIRYGFAQLRLGRIIQGVMASNHHSVNLMHRLGFRVEKGLRANQVVGILEQPPIQLEFRRFRREEYPTYASWFLDEELNKHLGPMDTEWLEAVLSESETEGITWSVYQSEELVAVVETAFDPAGILPTGFPALAVKPTMRGRGIGKAVLQQALAMHQAQGRVEHVVIVEPSNLVARKLIERVGFTAITGEPNEHGYIEFRKA